MTKQALSVADARSIHHSEPASPPQPSPLAAIAKQLPTGWLDREAMWTAIDNVLKPDGPDHHGRAVYDRAAAISAQTALVKGGHVEVGRGDDGEERYRRVAR